MTPSSELLETLAELQQRYPHWRFGQLLANVAGWADREDCHVEDEQLLAAAKADLAQVAQAVIPSNT